MLFANIFVVREERPKSAQEQDETAREMLAESEPSFFANPKRLIQTGVAVVLLLVAIYVLVPKLFDLQDAWGKVKEGDPLSDALEAVDEVCGLKCDVASDLPPENWST